jgi:3-isopropylmalate dehydrogenase
MNLFGKAWKLGDNVDTDQIIPARYLVTSDEKELASHCLEDTAPEFTKKVSVGDVLVGLKNFGCGSSREHAPLAIKGAGVSAVVAKSYARIFYRNSINLGLPLFESDQADRIEQDDVLEINPTTGVIKNITKEENYQAQPLPSFAQEIMAAGGLMKYVAKKRASRDGDNGPSASLAPSALPSTYREYVSGSPSVAASHLDHSRRPGEGCVMTTHRIALLGGDGIGQEVTPEARKVLEVVGRATGTSFEFEPALIGGAAIDATGEPLPASTLRLCEQSDAILFGAVGGHKWDALPQEQKPERGLLGLRKELDLFANLRPAKCFPMLVDSSPLKREVVEGTDIMVIRELTGGLYFGEPRGREEFADGGARAVNTMAYTSREVERVARAAFDVAMKRKKRLASVDKANVLVVSQLWREVVTRVGKDYPQVALEHVLVDNCAMALVHKPTHFDTIVTENTFGDILSDEAAILAGSMGMLPSASIGGRVGLYEPVHGTAPDIAGQGVANPIAAILSAAMLLRYSLSLGADADRIEAAVIRVLEQGHRTRDVHAAGTKLVGTKEMGDLISTEVEKSYS